ncbi:hypothetical protein [Flavonifractor plautii]|jgi:hypothetical protein|uniref:hypothetical protein n=1 Tax=Flavonifractor plautii TaxID=292800 RepID=UPI0018AB3586|nr:hypothetical protein [Flavonifractor plautii]MDB7954346.1 hypothetical protein [Flavonifractor plautii]
MIENFEVIHSLQIGAREAVVGVSPDQEFMCCFCTQDDIAEYYSEAMSSTDYLEIMELYADRLKGQIAAAQAQRRTLHIPLDMLGREHCFPLLDVDDITGKVVAVKPASLRYEYQRADCQLILVTGGSGARGNSRGTSVYGVNVFTGRRAGRWERGDILGEVRPECLPQWAKDHLRTIERKQTLEKKRGSR